MVSLNSKIAGTVVGTNNNLQQNAANVEKTKKVENRVEELKRQINSNEYKFDLEKTAQSVAKALI